MARLRETFQSIREQYGIRGVLGWPQKRRWGVCPIPGHTHTHYTPSFSIFYRDGREYWKCHGNCPSNNTHGSGGDVIDLVGYLHIPGYHRGDIEMRKEAATILTNGQVKFSPPVAPPPSPILPQWLWQEMLPPTQRIIEYALSRGLTQTQIDKFKIGTPKPDMEERFGIYSPEIWMAIPTFHNGVLWGIKLRNTTKFGLRYISVKGSKRGLFNYDAVNEQLDKPVLVLKGEIAAMVADRFGFLACAPTAGEASDVGNVRHALALSKCIVVGDNDPKPEVRAAIVKATEMRAAVLDADVHFPPEQWKGWDDWALADTERAIEETQKWIEQRMSRP